MSKIKGFRKKRDLLALLIIAIYICVCGMENVQAAEKEKFPTKMIKVIVPQPPGASIDMEPRGFVPYLAKKLGVDVMIENMAGAGGKMGLTKVWKADPDGYTLAYHGIPQAMVIEFLFKAEYKTKEFAHVFALSNTNMVLVVHPDNWKTIEEFLKVAREKTLRGAVPSIGSVSHICGVVSGDKLGMKSNWVFFDGSGEVLTNVAGKHLDFGIVSTNSAQTLVAAGKIRPLLLYSQAPDQFFPNVPFPKKLGYTMPIVSSIRGFVAPPKTPADRVKILRDAMFKVAEDPAYLDWARKRMLEIAPLDGDKYLAETEKGYAVVDTYKNFFRSQ